MSNKPNYFAVLNIELSIEIDINFLENQLFFLQSQFHPDKMIGASIDAQNLALEKSQEINQAFNILKDPYERLKHFLEIKGIDINAYELDSAFLMEAMLWREELFEANKEEELDSISKKIQSLADDVWQQVQHAVQNNNFVDIAILCNKFKFIKRFQSEVNKRISEL
jgi:molecular chaperone HscB